MPELPEVETVVRTLAPVLVGKRIESFELRWPRTLADMSIESARQRLTGRRVTSIFRRAKLIVLTLDSGDVLTVHLRMTGELLFRHDAQESRAPEREPYLRARFGLSDCSELVFYDTRKFGRISCLTPGELRILDQSLGVEPLSAEFTVPVLAELLAHRQRQIKPLLLDQVVIAGLGNIYVDEALFRAGIHPLTRSNQIDPDRVEALHCAIVSILQGAVDRRGTTFRNYRSGLGEAGGNKSTLLVYGQKSGAPCPQCGTELERMIVGQRGTVFCPRCQPLTPAWRTPSR